MAFYRASFLQMQKFVVFVVKNKIKKRNSLRAMFLSFKLR